MHHLSLLSPEGKALSLELSKDVKIGEGSSRCFELTTCSTACAGPVNPLLISTLRSLLPSGVLNALAAALRGGNPLALSTHRLPRGLPGYLILFDPHAFAHQRQFRTRKSPSPLVFLHISAHFTATHGIPLSSSGSSFPVSDDPPRLSRGL